jgi:hypothetical protein
VLQKNISILKDRIASTEDVIKTQEALCQKEPESFAYKLSLASLKSRLAILTDEYTQLLHERTDETLDILLEGSRIRKGSAPVMIVADVLGSLQGLIHSVARAIHSGPKNRGRIPVEIAKITDLQLNALYAGSLGMKLSAPISTDIFGESLITKTLEELYKILEAKDNPEEIINSFSKLGNHSYRRYSIFLSHVIRNSIHVRTKWVDLSGQERTWAPTEDELRNIYDALLNIGEGTSETLIAEGVLMGASLLRDRFEFIKSDNGETITGTLADQVREKIQPYFGVNCKALLQSHTFVNRATAESRTSWSLLDLASK